MPYQTSNCFCPANTTSSNDNNDITTSADLTTTFNNALAGRDPILAVSDTYEVDVFNCDDEMDNFTSVLSLRFLLDGTNDIASVGRLVEDTYNALVRLYCDPLDRHDISLEFVDLMLGDIVENGCSLYTIQWNVAGKCRGCDDMTSILDDMEGSSQAMRFLSEGTTSDGNRRRVTGSNLCFCPTGTVASRAPTLAELYDALEDALQTQPVGNSNICGVGTSAEPSQVPSSAPTERFCDVTSGNSFSSEVFLTVSVSAGASLSATDFNVLGDKFETVYNTIMDGTFKTCDEQYRIVSSVTVSTSDNSQSRRMTDDPTEASTALRGVERRVQTSGSQTLVLVISGLCDNCGPDTDFFDVINAESFLSLYSVSVLETIQSIDSISDLHEVNSVSCSNDIVEFTQVVIVEYVVDCFDPLFDDNQTAQVEQAFVATYNNLMVDYCDPFQRTVLQTELLRVGVNTTVSGNIPVEFQIFATCRGCAPNTTDIYDIPSAIASDSRRLAPFEILTDIQGRNLQVDDVCYCSAQPVGDRAPFQSEFIDSYQIAIELLQLQCIASVGLCDFRYGV